ncbi:hypothetical protein HGRIS_004414 [Hohenbuehelia grisea]
MFTLLHSGTFGSMNHLLSLMFTSIPATWIIEDPVVLLPESLGPVDVSAFHALSFAVVYNPVSPSRGTTISRDSSLPVCILHPPLLVAIRGDATNQTSPSDSQALARSQLNSVATTVFAIFSRMWELKHASLDTPSVPDWLIFFGIIYLPDRVDIVAHQWMPTGSSFHVVSDVVETFSIGSEEQRTRGIDDLLDLALCLMTLQRHVFRMTALWEDFIWPWPDFNDCYNSIYDFLGFWTPSPSEAAEREGIVLHVRYCDDTPLTDDQSSWSATLEEKLNSRQSVAEWAAHVSTFNDNTRARDVPCEDFSTATTSDPRLTSLPQTLVPLGFLNICALSASAMTAQRNKRTELSALHYFDRDIRLRWRDMARTWYSARSKLPIQIPCDLSNHLDMSHSDEFIWTAIYRSLVNIVRHRTTKFRPDVQLKSAAPPHPAPDFFQPLRSERILKSFLALFLSLPQMYLLSASNKALTEGLLANVFGLQEVSASFSSVMKAHICTFQAGFSPVLALVEFRTRMWREHVECDPPLPPHSPDSIVPHHAALEVLAPSLKYMIWAFYYHHPDMYPGLLEDEQDATKYGLLPDHYLLHSFTIDDQSCALDLYWPSLRAIVDGKHYWNLHSYRVESYIISSPYMDHIFKLAAVVFQVKKHADALQADMHSVELPDGFVDKLLPHVEFELSPISWL